MRNAWHLGDSECAGESGGVRRVHVVSYQSPEGILGEVFTNEGTGTMIVADVNALSPAEQQSHS